MLSNKKNYINFWILFISFFIFTLRWYNPITSFDEQIDISIIFESIGDGYMYLAPFKAFANLDLSNSYDPIIKNLNNISVPIGAFYLHFIVYYLLGPLTFIILEFFFILVFIIIFYKIARFLSLTRVESLTVSVILLSAPILLELLSLSETTYIRVIHSDLYSLRFPRPLVTNIFFYSFILYIFKLLNKKFFIKKNFILIGIITGLTFTSFFHLFFLEQLVLLVIIFYVYKYESLNKFKNKFNFIILYLISFLVVSLPFLINMYFTEVDFLERSGVTFSNYERKSIIISYLLGKLLNFNFLIVFLISILILIFVNYNKKFVALKKLNIFLIIFYTSILAPFLFVLLSPKIFSHLFLLINFVIISAFLLFFFSIILFIKFYFIKFSSLKNINNFAFLIIFILLSCNFYQINKNYNEIQLKEESVTLRNEFKKISSFIKEDNNFNLNNNLLTFDNKFITWAILNDIKYLKYNNGILTPKTNKMIENNLIQTFKYLNLSKDDFYYFIKNKKLSSWRYRNENIKNLFWMRYQANSLITHQDSKNFDPEILNFINKSSPLLSHQLVMPNNEIKRLLLKFDKINSDPEDPDLIILNKDNKALVKSKIDLKKFCKKFDGKYYVFYYKSKTNFNCIK
jgi:hypothetical protein